MHTLHLYVPRVLCPATANVWGMHVMQLGRLGCRCACAATSCTNCGVLQQSGSLLLTKTCATKTFWFVELPLTFCATRLADNSSTEGAVSVPHIASNHDASIEASPKPSNTLFKFTRHPTITLYPANSVFTSCTSSSERPLHACCQCQGVGPIRPHRNQSRRHRQTLSHWDLHRSRQLHL